MSPSDCNGKRQQRDLLRGHDQQVACVLDMRQGFHHQCGICGGQVWLVQVLNPHLALRLARLDKVLLSLGVSDAGDLMPRLCN